MAESEIEQIKKLNYILRAVADMQYYIYKIIDKTGTYKQEDFMDRFNNVYYDWKKENPQYTDDILNMEKELSLDVNEENIKRIKEDALDLMMNINN